MNTAELNAIEFLLPIAAISDSSADLEPLIDGLEVVVEDSIEVENLELERDGDGDELAAARPSGYRKTRSDDAVGAFLKKWHVIRYLNPTKKWS